jgi:hypothetical protein|tara:strand:- start:397 stop:858 length:462 start_codon:yes stop_codon:yes gene_type:complete
VRQFKFQKFWFVPYVLILIPVGWIFYGDIGTAIEFITTLDGSYSDATSTIGVIAYGLIIGVLIPYRVITDPFRYYAFDDKYLYCKSWRGESKVELKSIVHVLVKLKVARAACAPYMIIDVVGVDKPIKIPSGFYLSDEDYETFRWKVPLKEQK